MIESEKKERKKIFLDDDVFSNDVLWKWKKNDDQKEKNNFSWNILERIWCENIIFLQNSMKQRKIKEKLIEN